MNVATDPHVGAAARAPEKAPLPLPGLAAASVANTAGIRGWLGAFRERFRNGVARIVVSDVVVAVLAAPALLVIWLLRPFAIIRIVPFFSERIGHFAANTEIYLCERDAGIGVPKKRYFDLWYYDLSVCNRQLQKMWNRTVTVCPLELRLLNFLIRRMPGGAEHCFRIERARDVHYLLDQSKPHLAFTPGEEESGRAALAEMGVPAGARFVCFVARDPAYVASYLRDYYPGYDGSYHDYRNSNIENYLPAVQRLADAGYYAIRAGSVVQQQLNTAHPRIIDYASGGHRTEFLDIYLAAKCEFFISCGTGIDQVAMIFRRPMLFVNFAQLEACNTWSSNHILIPKKLWLRGERRFMTFREILDSGAGRYVRSEQFMRRGIELIENTPDEIAAAVSEMEQRLRGVWRETDEDVVLQRRFWALYKSNELNRQFRSRLGTNFLRQNRELLN